MDEKSRKQALRMLSYGIYILTSKAKEDYCAATVTWVSQASFEPSMISVCIKRDSGSYTVVKERGEFILHLLGEKQKDLAASFLKQTVINGGYINGYQFTLQHDLPLITDVPAYLFCQVIEILKNGDHPLFLAEVKDAIVQRDSNPLELKSTGWYYGG